MRTRPPHEVLGWMVVGFMTALLIVQIVHTAGRFREMHRLEKEIAQKRHLVDSLTTVLQEEARR